jgi:hypothetical protein
LTHFRTVVIIALAGFCSPVVSQERCSDSDRLTAEAETTFANAAGSVGPGRCDAYIRYSVAWAEAAKYARSHREHCDISASSLSEINELHRKAVAERIDACGGPNSNSTLPKGERHIFPPEIRPQWHNGLTN